MGKIKQQLEKIKLWQEECKLVAMFFGAVSAVAIFFTQLLKGQLVKVEELKSATPLDVPSLPLKHFIDVYTSDAILLISGLLFVLFFSFGIYFLIKVIKKHRRGFGLDKFGEKPFGASTIRNK